jgi:sulfate adenylyltransferase
MTELEGAPALDVLGWAADQYAPKLTFATGFGVEGCVIIDLIGRHRLPIDLFTLDTGVLFPETYALWKRLEATYGITIRAVHPVEVIDRLWERDTDRCCDLRKVQPLRAELAKFDAWITAIRRDQTPDRANAQVRERDKKFGLAKVNPLVAWTHKDVWRHIADFDVPYNPLHDQGYPSIGCQPCTSPVAEGEDPRAGRWRGSAKKECGLHSLPVVNQPATAEKPQKETVPMSVSSLVTPHGGTLVDRFVTGDGATALSARAAKLPRITLDARELADLELIAIGAASPLTGFTSSADYRSILADTRLANGTVWPFPFTLAVDDATRAQLNVGGHAALYDATGRLWGTIEIADIYARDLAGELAAVYGTDDDKHPGVAYTKSRPATLVGGDVDVLPLPDDLPFAQYRKTPRQLRAEIEARGWKKVSGFQTRNPIHRAHEHLTKLALEVTDGIVIHPLVGETKNDDVPAAVRFQAYETLIAKYYPPARTILAAFPAAMRYAGPKEALFHALVRKNYGITSICVGRDHAGVGSFYPPLAAQEIFERFPQRDLGVAPLKFEPTFFCKACDNLASTRTCPHDKEQRVELSGTKVREILKTGGHLPKEFSRPEVAEVLRAHYQKEAGIEVTTATAPAPASHGPKGFILWFTGLSGAGKSTLATALAAHLDGHRRLEILDGDEVRTHLSKGLGFSKEDRDTNIHRIGFVARTLAQHGVGVVTAAISPYAETRAQVRALAEQRGVTFVEVFANAKLDSLVERDVKGLYKKAIAGEVKHFTGVSDPYEAPTAPDVEVFTDVESVEESLAKIVGALRARGLITVPFAAPGNGARAQVHAAQEK